MSIPPVINMPSLSDGPQGGVCASFETQLDAAIAVLEMAKDTINAPVEALRGMLDDIVGEAASVIDDINSGLNDIADAITDSIPSVEGTDEWTDMMAACGLLENEVKIQSPKNIASDLLNSTISSMTNALDAQLDLLESIVEIPIATAINAINSILEELKVPDFLSSIDEFLECMDAICTDADLTDKVNYINNLLDDMYVDDNGFLLDQQLMNESGISQTQKDNITQAKADLLDTGDTAVNSATSAIESGVNSVKNLVATPSKAVEQVKSFFT